MAQSVNQFGNDGVSFTAVANGGTTGAFVLLGGLYNFGSSTTVVSGGTGSATLLQEMPDGQYVPAGGSSATLTTPGSENVSLPAGTYNVSGTTTSGSSINGVVARVPYRAA
jgi:hypothetical protein